MMISAGWYHMVHYDVTEPGGWMRPRAPRPDSLQSVPVLEILAALDPQHGEAGVPFKDLEAAPVPAQLSRPTVHDSFTSC